MKKLLLVALIVIFSVCFIFSLVGCNKTEDKTTIVYLGDSIAEAIIGPSSLSERDNYGYYAVVGKINDYKYYNHSVSGHQTSSGMLTALTGDHVDGLLEMVSKEKEDGALLNTHLREADIIHISILGNNALQFDLGWLLLEAADPEFNTKMENKTSLLYHMMHGIEGLDEDAYTRTSMRNFDAEGNPLEEVYTFPNTIENISDIVDRLKEINPNAKIIFQKVYNPVYEGTTLVNQNYWDALAEITDDGRFGAKGTPINTWAQRRLVAQQILDVLNGVLDDYNEANPGKIDILDINKYFDDITNTATGNKLATDSVGAQLLYTDWTHPSNKGHAAIAAATQTWLEDNNLANKDALKNYKNLRIEQINRMYAGLEGFDATAAINAINAATTMTEVSNVYFAKTDAFEVPNYYRDNLTYNRKGETYYSKTMKFEIDEENTKIVLDDSIYSLVAGLALNKEQCYFEFKSDGTMHAQLQTKDGLLENIGGLLKMFGTSAEELMAGVAEVNLEEAVNSAVSGFFPGFSILDLEDSLERIQKSLGVTISGLDFDDPDVIEILDYIKTNKTLPSTILSDLPQDLVLCLSWDADYRIKEVKTWDGKTKKVIYIGKEAATNPNTQPFIVMEETKARNDDNVKVTHLEFTAEFIGTTIALNEIVED